MRPLYFGNGVLKLIDQTKLPTETHWHQCHTYQQVAEAIRDMIVRGAPAIGVTAAYGIAIGMNAFSETNKDLFLMNLHIAKVIKIPDPQLSIYFGQSTGL